MKYLVVMIMTILAISQACAQTSNNVCNVAEPNQTVYYGDLTTIAGSKFSCLPAPGGTGVGLTIKTNVHGVMPYWYCLKNGKYVPNFAAATWARIATGELKPDTPLADPQLTPVWCPHVKEMYSKVPQVAPTGFVTIGIMSYDTTSTGLVKSAGLITKGLQCDCTTSLTIGTVKYCTFAGAAKASIRASCAKP